MLHIHINVSATSNLQDHFFEEGGNKRLLAFDHGRNGSMLDFFTEIQNKLEPIQETDMVKIPDRLLDNLKPLLLQYLNTSFYRNT